MVSTLAAAGLLEGVLLEAAAPHGDHVGASGRRAELAEDLVGIVALVEEGPLFVEAAYVGHDGQVEMAGRIGGELTP